MSNPDDVREFLERWAGEHDNVEEGLGGDADREPVDNSLGNIEIVVSEDDDDEDDECNGVVVDKRTLCSTINDSVRQVGIR